MTPKSVIGTAALHELVQTARAAPSGDFVEVGVYKGGSAAHLAGVAKDKARRLFLFDTFTGIPFADPDLDHHKVGDFNDVSLEEVRAALPEATIAAGVFPNTLKYCPDLGPIALAHIDCDQYKSVRESAIALVPLMAPGGVMVFDDYNVLNGARKAVDEQFGKRVEVSPCGKAWVRF
jgi:O-methyltransferase